MSKILLIDDNELLLQMFTDRLKQDGHTIFHAENGKQGLTVFTKEHPEIIVLDIVMPVMDGLTMLKTLRTMPDGKTIPVVILTSMEDAEHVSRALEEEVYFYLIKNKADRELVAKTIQDILADESSKKLQ